MPELQHCVLPFTAYGQLCRWQTDSLVRFSTQVAGLAFENATGGCVLIAPLCHPITPAGSSAKFCRSSYSCLGSHSALWNVYHFHHFLTRSLVYHHFISRALLLRNQLPAWPRRLQHGKTRKLTYLPIKLLLSLTVSCGAVIALTSRVGRSFDDPITYGSRSATMVSSETT